MSKKDEFYSIKDIKKYDAHYNVIFGERSNGKTYQVLKEGYEKFLDSGEVEMTAILRRWEEDFIGAQSMRHCYKSLMCNADGENIIKKLSKGKYEGVEYYAGVYYLTEADGDRIRRTNKMIAIGLSLTGWEHSKGASDARITTILFDEFMTRGRYLPDEFVIFQNLLSSIIRRRSNVTVWMCANTLNKYGCPYFSEMGLYKIKQMKKGDIDLYTYGTTGLKVAVQFSDSPVKNKPSDVYFAFDNPKLQMITGQENIWEMDIYPHCPCKYVPQDIIFTYFIEFDREKLQCEIISKDDMIFTFIHRKTTPFKNTDEDLIYTTEHSPKHNIHRNLFRGRADIDNKLRAFFARDKVFYQDNETGEIVNSYLEWCKIN